jgi:hypothetical protein
VGGKYRFTCDQLVRAATARLLQLTLKYWFCAEV